MFKSCTERKALTVQLKKVVRSTGPGQGKISTLKGDKTVYHSVSCALFQGRLDKKRGKVMILHFIVSGTPHYVIELNFSEVTS